jgi:hypothetical protein
VLKVLDQAGVNIEYMYAFSSYRPGKAILIFRFEDPDQAVKVLLDQGIRALDGDELIHADG